MSKGKSKAVKASGIELTNEQIRQAARGLQLLLQERLPRVVGSPLQVRYQALKFALVAPEAEHDRLVMLYVKRDKKKQPVRVDGGFAVEEKHIETFQQETTDLWAEKHRVNISLIGKDEIPDKIEGKPLTVAGIVWDWLAPITAK